METQQETVKSGIEIALDFKRKVKTSKNLAKEAELFCEEIVVKFSALQRDKGELEREIQRIFESMRRMKNEHERVVSELKNELEKKTRSALRCVRGKNF